jgi:hypothetical protein
MAFRENLSVKSETKSPQAGFSHGKPGFGFFEHRVDFCWIAIPADVTYVSP